MFLSLSQVIVEISQEGRELAILQFDLETFFFNDLLFSFN